MEEQNHSQFNERRRFTRRPYLIVTIVTISLLAGGAALASDAFQSDDDNGRSDLPFAASLSTGAPVDNAGPPAAPTGTPHASATVVPPSSTPTPTPSDGRDGSATPSPPTESETPDPTPTDSDDPRDDPRDDDNDGNDYSGDFPTMDTTGPRISTESMRSSDSITTDSGGQVIAELDVTSRIKIVHDDVTVRDVRINHTAQKSGQYALLVADKANGECPTGVVIEHIEIVGDTDVLTDDAKAVYSECPFTLRNSRVYDVGTGIRIVKGSRIEGNFVHANFINPGSDTHRSGLGLNGGSDHVISGNTIDCEGSGCSGALVMYGDFAQVSDVLIENNLLNTTGSYCTYAGSLDSKPHPIAENVRYIGNHFGRKYFDTCGRYGPVAGRSDGGGPGFVWQNNVWADTGEPVD